MYIIVIIKFLLLFENQKVILMTKYTNYKNQY